MIEADGFEIRPVTENDLPAVLEVYRQCEDFLALGPQPRASLPMVLQDIETSQAEGGVFCGIYDLTGKMLGIADFVPDTFEGDPHHAFLSLLMIARPYRKKGLGTAVVRVIEDEIARRPHVRSILSAVQVNNEAALCFWQRRGYEIVSGPEARPDRTTVFRLQKDMRKPDTG